MKILAFPAFSNRNSNPYNYLLNSALEEAGVEVIEFTARRSLYAQYNILHIHWPEWSLNNPNWFVAATKSAILLLCLTIAKVRGRKIVWTVHNLSPHKVKHPITSWLFWRAFKQLADATLSLSKANRDKFLEYNKDFNHKINEVTYHGLYSGFYENNTDKEKALSKLKLTSTRGVCLFMGQLKPYKGIEGLIELFSKAPPLREKTLIIAGKFSSTHHRKEIISKIEKANNIKLYEGFIKNEELQYFFSASELCILPFKNIFNSGSTLLSASFNTPVLVPYSENFAEYEKILPNLIKMYKGHLCHTDIIQAMDSNNNTCTVQNPDELQWEHIATKTKMLFEQVTNKE